MKTSTTSLGMWILESNDASRTFEKKEEVFSHLSGILEGQRSGRALVSEDVGARSWFAKFLGLAPRIIQMRFAVEWCDGAASLIFFDEADSEYRAIDSKQPIVVSEATRKAIAHGEIGPHPESECIALHRAGLAIADFMKSGVRPEWLDFKYVS